IGPPVLAGPDSAAAGAIRRELVLTSADQVCVSGLVLARGYQLTGATIGPVSRDGEDVWLCYGICRPDVTLLEWRVGERSALGRPVPIMGDDEVRVFALLLPDLGQSFVSHLRVVDAKDAERQTLKLLVDSPN